MSTATLVRSKKVSKRSVRRAEAASHAREVRSDQRISASKLQEVEDRLLADAIEHHPNRDVALDRLADDLDGLSAKLERSRRGPLLLRSTASLNRMEDLLLEAVVRTHPNRERALDRLLEDVAVEYVPVEMPEDFIDNDFDGMS